MAKGSSTRVQTAVVRNINAKNRSWKKNFKWALWLQNNRIARQTLSEQNKKILFVHEAHH
jgi:hypothetical protein